MLLLCVGNSILPIMDVKEKIDKSQYTKIEYLNLYELSKDNKLVVKLGGTDIYVFEGLIFNLMDYGIENFEMDGNLESTQYISDGRGKISYCVKTECK